MAKINIFRCDICFTEVRYGDWTTAPNRMFLKSEGAGIQFERKYEDACRVCADAINKGIVSALEERMRKT